MEEISVQARARSLIKHEGQPNVTLERDELSLPNKKQDVFHLIKSQTFGFLANTAKSLQICWQLCGTNCTHGG